MRGKVAKRVRRDLRRAVGLEAISVIDAHTNALDHQVLPNLNALQLRVDDIDHRLHLLAQRHAASTQRHENLSDEIRHQVDGWRTRWQRLRWLVTGH